MPNRVLITGIQEKNSGKTFVTELLGHILNKNNQPFEVYKPVSGSHYYYQASNVFFGLSYGTIISQDLRTTHQAVHPDCNRPLELLNPIHTLFFTHNLGSYVQNRMKDYINGSLDQPGLVRYGLANLEGKVERHILYNPSLMPESLHPLLNNAMKTKEFATLDELQRLDAQLTTKALETTWRSLRNENVVLTEAFNMYIPPPVITKDVDVVLLVGPGIVASVNTQRFHQALEFLHNGISPMNKIIELTGVEEVREVPLFRSVHDLEGGKWSELQNWLLSLVS